MFLTPQQMRDTEEAAFARGVSAERLMDQAGAHIAGAVTQFSPEPGVLFGFVAKGHNGGDVLAAAPHLIAAGWEVTIILISPIDKFRPLTRKKLDALPHGTDVRTAPLEISNCPIRPGRPVVVLDGLLGTGASGPLRPEYFSACQQINQIRTHHHATTFAIDIPSGLDGTTGVPDANATVADITLTLGYAKTGLFTDAATTHVGRVAVLPLDGLGTPAETSHSSIPLTPGTLRPLLPRRSYSTHKGEAGRTGIVAGSPGLTGAALLCASAAVRAGAGLVTLYIKDEIYPVIAAAADREIMVKPVSDFRDVAGENLDVLAVGSGTGKKHPTEILDLIRTFPGALIADADALNILAEHGLEPLRRRRPPALLTPHPGEMQRLLGGRTPGDRPTCARDFADNLPGSTLLLKGSRTVITTASKPTAFNTTGHPGMATGGMGDVLTGICGALYPTVGDLHDTACLSAWLAGRAAERACNHGSQSPESLKAGDVIDHLGGAFNDLRTGCY